MFVNPIEKDYLSKSVIELVCNENPHVSELEDRTTFDKARAILGQSHVASGCTHIFVGSNKGGAGKSVISLQLAWLLALRGHKVLLAEMDGQANLSRRLMKKSGDLRQPAFSFYDVVTGSKKISEVVYPVAEGFDLLSANSNLSKIENFLYSKFAETQVKSESDKKTYEDVVKSRKQNREMPQVFKDVHNTFRDFGEGYDYVIYDSNPETNNFTKLSMLCLDLAIIPLQGRRSVEEGFQATTDDIRETLSDFGRVDCIKNFAERIMLVFNNNTGASEESVDKAMMYFKGQYPANVVTNPIVNSDRMGVVSDSGRPVFAHEEIEERVIKGLASFADEVEDLARYLKDPSLGRQKESINPFL